jgi:Icc-related predicted phosphoesterase
MSARLVLATLGLGGALAFVSPALADGPADSPVPRVVSGVVFDDADGDGRRGETESGIPGVAVSDGHDVVLTGADGAYRLAVAVDAAVVVVRVPDGRSAVGKFWRPLPAADEAIDFALARRPTQTSFSFLHASDTHLSEKSLPRMRRLREIVAQQKPDFVLLTGDLVRDALRVHEPEARGYYEMVVAELAQFPVPVFTVPGNHELFGIERHLSLVPADNPLYGRRMYRHYLGPEYYSFDFGGVHFVGIDSVDNDDLWYYGHVDAAQVAWLEKDLAHVPANVPVVTFNHIPFATSVDVLNGYTDDPPAPTLIRINGRPQYRHVVSNLAEVLAKIAPHRWEIALGGHMHVSESLAFDTPTGRMRFHQTGAVVGPSEAQGMPLASGVTLYHVRDGHVDDGAFLPLNAPAKP